MKKFYGFIVLIPVIVLAACFSLWSEDEATLSLVLSGEQSRTLINADEVSEINHFYVFLEGPGGRTERDFSGGIASIKLVPGKWTVTVKAYKPNPNQPGSSAPVTVGDDSHAEILRAIGTKTLTLKPGDNPPETVNMTSVTEVWEWWDLMAAIVKDDYIEGDREEIILIRNDLLASSSTAVMDDEGNTDTFYSVPIERKITLMAEKPVTISRGFLNDHFFEVGEVGILNLGMKGMGGTITIDGGWDELNPSSTTSDSPIIFVSGGGQLFMHDGVILQNRRNTIGTTPGGAVYVGGSFIIDGGLITGNYCPTGGAVYVDENREFTMTGGIISGNFGSDGYGFGAGGAVYVDSGIFDMTGGTIKGNTALSSGGAVYIKGDNYSGVDYIGYFNMSGSAEISGNFFEENTNPSNPGAGVYVDVFGQFTMNGGYIRKNNADSNGRIINEDVEGGGVFVNDGGIFVMNRGEISGNMADKGGGVFVDALWNRKTEVLGRITMYCDALKLSSGRITGNVAETPDVNDTYGGGVYFKNDISIDKNDVDPDLKNKLDVIVTGNEPDNWEIGW